MLDTQSGAVGKGRGLDWGESTGSQKPCEVRPSWAQKGFNLVTQRRLVT